MIRKLSPFLVAPAAAALASASPASAARVLCTAGPTPAIDLTTQACVYNPEVSGNDNDNLANVTQAILEATGVSVSLTLYGKSDDSSASLFTFSNSVDGFSTTNWSTVNGTLINYVTVKAANEFKVYRLSGLGASSGTATSLDLLTPNGRNQPGISHVSFWTAAAAAVPEPRTWGLLILGFGAIGGAMRRRTRPGARPALT